MKKRWTTVTLLFCMALFLAGCGAVSGGAAIDGAASGGAVSGGAMTAGSVTGAAIEKEQRASVITKIYPFCNSQNLYEMEDNYIIQRSLDGEELERVQAPGAARKKNEVEIKYVGDGEIYYTVFRDGDELDKAVKKESEYKFCEDLWRMPLRQEEMLLDEAQKVMEVVDGMGNLLYADENIVAYLSVYDYSYYEYDCKQKKPFPVCREDKKTTYYDIPKGKFGTVMEVANGGHMKKWVLLTKYEDDGSVYAHEVGSGTIQKAATHYINRYSSGMQMIYARDSIYYTELMDYWWDPYDEEDEGKCHYDIWRYDGKTGENEILVREEQFREMYPKFLYIEGFFADESQTLYAVLEMDDEDSGMANYKAVSISLSGGEPKIRPIEPLNEAIFNSEREFCEVQGFAGGKCYFETEKYYVCDLATGEVKRVKKKDPEYYFWKWYWNS